MLETILGILGVLLILWVLSLACRRGNPAWAVLKQYRYAHRGLHEKPKIPENSLPAFQRAVDHGFGAELDVHLLTDGHLAVIHDSNLKRTAGADVNIESLSSADLANYVLEESTEHIPLLEQVLPLFAGNAPLIIELKPAGGNHRALSEALAAMLDHYQGDYCIESFDPRVLWWFRRHRPQTCRGQLAENFLVSKDNQLPRALQWLLTNLLENFLTCPDFIAYKFEDRKLLSPRLCHFIHRPVEFSWTIRSEKDLDQAEKEGRFCIFEQFVPRGVEKKG